MFFIGFIFGTILFLIYVIFSPGLKGIAFRPNASNQIVFSPSSIASLMFSPLHKSFLWNPSMLTCNWLFMSLLTGILFVLYKYIRY